MGQDILKKKLYFFLIRRDVLILSESPDLSLFTRVVLFFKGYDKQQ